MQCDFHSCPLYQCASVTISAVGSSSRGRIAADAFFAFLLVFLLQTGRTGYIGDSLGVRSSSTVVVVAKREISGLETDSTNQANNYEMARKRLRPLKFIYLKL